METPETATVNEDTGVKVGDSSSAAHGSENTGLPQYGYRTRSELFCDLASIAKDLHHMKKVELSLIVNSVGNLLAVELETEARCSQNA